MALNLLVLSAQVPAAWLYACNGAYKKYFYNHTVICYRKTTNKDISKFSYKTALAVHTLKALRKDKVDETVIEKLRCWAKQKLPLNGATNMSNNLAEIENEKYRKDQWVRLENSLHNTAAKIGMTDVIVENLW